MPQATSLQIARTLGISVSEADTIRAADGVTLAVARKLALRQEIVASYVDPQALVPTAIATLEAFGNPVLS
jgi:hypothetical protein